MDPAAEQQSPTPPAPGPCTNKCAIVPVAGWNDESPCGGGWTGVKCDDAGRVTEVVLVCTEVRGLSRSGGKAWRGGRGQARAEALKCGSAGTRRSKLWCRREWSACGQQHIVVRIEGQAMK